MAKENLFSKALPPCVYYKHCAYYFVVWRDSKAKWIRLGSTKAEAASRFQEIAPTMKNSAYAKKYVYLNNDSDRGPIPTPFLREILRHAKKNSASRSLPFEITLSDLQEIAAFSNGCCELTGIKFEYGIANEAKGWSTRRKRLWAPSIDRKDNSLGYTRENIRLICSAVNIMRQEFTDEVLLKIATGLSKMRRRELKNQATTK